MSRIVSVCIEKTDKKKIINVHTIGFFSEKRAEIFNRVYQQYPTISYVSRLSNGYHYGNYIMGHDKTERRMIMTYRSDQLDPAIVA